MTGTGLFVRNAKKSSTSPLRFKNIYNSGMRIDIFTLFPEMFEGPLNKSIVGRAQEKGLVEINIHNLRDWAKDSYKTVDDKPFGGGVGMIMRVDIVDAALQDIKTKDSR